MDALHDDYYTFMITSRLIFLMMNNVSDKGVDIHFTCNNLFFFFEDRAVYEIMWKNMVEIDRS